MPVSHRVINRIRACFLKGRQLAIDAQVKMQMFSGCVAVRQLYLQVYLRMFGY